MQDWYPLKENNVGKKTILLQNGDGKKWAFPVENIKTGMNIYQPSSLKGKGIKFVLPYIGKLDTILRRLNIATTRMKMDSNLEKYLQDQIESTFQFAIFYGTPSPNQKITIQLNCGNNCIAYAKISNREHIKRYFIKEYELLKELEKRGVVGIPRAISLQEVGSQFVFLQSSYKSGKESVIYNLSSIHYKFLQDIWERTKTKKIFEETEYSKSLKELELYISDFKICDRDTIYKSIKFIKEKFRLEREFVVYHGDFTPWNMYIKEGKLYVFDFEYAKMEYPKYLDVFHFYMQIWYFVKHYNKEKIWNLYCKYSKEWELALRINDINNYYIAYLLEMIRLNKELEKKTKISISEESYQLWIFLLGKI